MEREAVEEKPTLGGLSELIKVRSSSNLVLMARSEAKHGTPSGTFNML